MYLQKKQRIHRLVAVAFLDNPFNYTDINHKDEIKTNNKVDNLEWCTREYNNNYGTKPQRTSATMKERYRKIKAEDSLEDVEELWTVNPDVEERLLLEAAFKQISDDERNIIVLHVLSGLKHREIAQLLELPLATVLSKYHRALKKLKGLLEENANER